MVLLLFGPPGCGKGTQSAFISRALGIPAISTGDLLRAECDAGTPLGRRVAAIVRDGGLVKDTLVNRMILKRIQEPDCRAGFLLDGYPRTLEQAGFLDRTLRERGFAAPIVIHLDAPNSILVRRLASRRQCPVCGRIYRSGTKCEDDGALLIQRADDREEAVQERLRIYAKQTNPVVGYYRNADYHRIDACRQPEEIFAEIEGILQPVGSEVGRNIERRAVS